MENINKFVMVSGPAACGKTTLVSSLNNTFNGYNYKPSRAYIDLAISRGIPVERAFDDITQNDAHDYFCQICTEHPYVIGDQHLSIQPNKDTAIALGTQALAFPDEPYVSNLDYSLFSKLSSSNIQTFLIYLSASPEILLERAYSRYQKEQMFIRNESIEDAIAEAEAEGRFFRQLVDETGLEHMVINTDNLTISEVEDVAIKRVRNL